jgi:hypothetical protein
MFQWVYTSEKLANSLSTLLTELSDIEFERSSNDCNQSQLNPVLNLQPVSFRKLTRVEEIIKNVSEVYVCQFRFISHL